MNFISASFNGKLHISEYEQKGKESNKSSEGPHNSGRARGESNKKIQETDEDGKRTLNNVFIFRIAFELYCI